MNHWLLVWLLLGVGLPARAQRVDTLPAPSRVVPVAAGVDRMIVDGESNILLLDQENSRLYKYLASTGYDSVLTIGGKANRIEGFLHPVEMVARNRQTLFLLDDIQRRLFMLNPNLRVGESVDFADFRPGGRPWTGEEVYPVSFDVAPGGEMFVLNQLNNRVLKINLFGEVETTFGGLDYGEGALYDPVAVLVDDRNYVYVVDTLAQQLTVFDLFGVYRYTLRPEAAFSWSRVRIVDRQALCFSAEAIHRLPLAGGKARQWVVPAGHQLRDLAASRDFLFLLLENAVHLYPK
ncbi:MAG: hypothetical protein D6722_09540 [Bacteroidetes bacterium]|nr:MAG: hypothetical protein D6722_09540 [Bacteroidota bacterium]